MRKMLLSLIITGFLGAHSGYAQNAVDKKAPAYSAKLYAGVGTGNVYGGLIGANLAYEPVKGLGLSAGIGYYLVGAGANAMVYYKFLSDKKVNPVVYGLYGTNGVINVRGADHYQKVFTGPSAGIGSFLKVGRNANRIFIGLQYSVWSKSFRNSIDAMKSNPAIKLDSSPGHIGINAGFGLRLR